MRGARSLRVIARATGPWTWGTMVASGVHLALRVWGGLIVGISLVVAGLLALLVHWLARAAFTHWMRRAASAARGLAVVVGLLALPLSPLAIGGVLSYLGVSDAIALGVALVVVIFPIVIIITALQPIPELTLMRGGVPADPVAPVSPQHAMVSVEVRAASFEAAPPPSAPATVAPADAHPWTSWRCPRCGRSYQTAAPPPSSSACPRCLAG